MNANPPEVKHFVKVVKKIFHELRGFLPQMIYRVYFERKQIIFLEWLRKVFQVKRKSGYIMLASLSTSPKFNLFTIFSNSFIIFPKFCDI